MKDDTQNAKKGVKKALSIWLNPLIIILSAINTGMSATIKLIDIISQQIGVANILLGNIGTGAFFNAISLTFNTYSFVNYFREKNLYKKCNYKETLEAKRKDKHRIQGICLDILCSVLFLTSAAVSIALFSSPIALSVTAPLITLGCIVMIGNIANSTYRQVKNFRNHLSQFSKEKQKELYTEMKKEINSSRLYKISAKVLPDIVVLAKLHASQEDKEKREKIQHLKEMLKGGNWRQIDGNTINKKGEVIEISKKDNKEKNIEQNSKVSSYLSLGKNAVNREKGSNTPRSL